MTRIDQGDPFGWCGSMSTHRTVGYRSPNLRFAPASGPCYAYPLTCVGVDLGVLTVYNDHAKDLTDERHELCLGRAGVLAATIAAMDTLTSDDPLADAIEHAFAFRAEVHQASGMVAARLDIPASGALVRMHAHAFATGRGAG